MIRAYKYRIYPTREQIVLIRRNCGAARFVYNYALGYYRDQRKHAEETSEEKVYYDKYAIDKIIRSLKDMPDENGSFPYAKIKKIVDDWNTSDIVGDEQEVSHYFQQVLDVFSEGA